MSWLQVLGIVLKVALVLADVVRERKQMAAGEASATLKVLEATMRMLRKLVLLAVLLPLAACQTTTRTSSIDTSCEAYEPIRYSRSYTEETRRQIVAHNAVWEALCK